MKKNKGVIGVGLVIAIVLGIVVVGGGAYYVGVNQNKKVVDVPEYKYEVPTPPFLDESNYVPPTPNCNSNSPSTIKLISPNGGETYTAGQKITIKWESCNVDPGTTAIFLIPRDSSSPYDQRIGVDDHSIFSLNVIDSGKVLSGNRTQEITIPKSLNFALPYYIFINGNGDATNIGSGYGPQDFSDGLFKINSSTKNTTSCTSDKGNVMTFEEALKIAKASSCNNVGTFTGEYGCNKNAGGLIDVYMTPTDKPLCGLACRISIDTKKAEEGWMCTGALKPIDDWQTYTNTEYGFSFNYPSSWKLSEDKSKKEVIISTNDTAGVDVKSYPSWKISFKTTDKSYFNSNRVSTKMGIITYNEETKSLFSDGCLKSESLGGSPTIQSIRFGGSLMSDPAYSESAILTTNGNIIVIRSEQGVALYPELESQLSTINHSFKLLNDNKVFVPECSK